MKKIWFRACNFILLLAVFCIHVSAQEPSPGSKRNFNQDGHTGVSANKLIDIVVASDPLVIKSRNEEQVANFLRDKNNWIIDYLISKYPQHGVPDVDVNDPATVWFGLICAMYEGVQFRPLKDVKFSNLSYTEQIPSWLSCTMSVLGVSYGINEAIGSLGTFSYGSVWKVVKFVVKKYVTGWLGTAVAIYEIANECF